MKYSILSTETYNNPDKAKWTTVLKEVTAEIAMEYLFAISPMVFEKLVFMVKKDSDDNMFSEVITIGEFQSNKLKIELADKLIKAHDERMSSLKYIENNRHLMFFTSNQ